MLEAKGKKLVHYTNPKNEIGKNTKTQSVFNFSKENGGCPDSFKYYNDYVVIDDIKESEEPVEDSWADEMGEGVPVDTEETMDKEEKTEYTVSEYMRATELADQVKDLNIDYSEWNQMNPEEREELVRPEIKRFVDSHRNEFDKNQQLFDLMIADLEDYNFHTESKVLIDEYRGGE